jgi:hypothetical protein
MARINASAVEDDEAGVVSAVDISIERKPQGTNGGSPPDSFLLW